MKLRHSLSFALATPLFAMGCGSSTTAAVPQQDAGAASDSGPTASTFGFTPSNIAASAIPSGTAADIDITDANCAIDTDMGTISCVNNGNAFAPYASVTQLGGGGKAGVFVMHSLRIEPSGALRVSGNAPLVLWVLTTVEIDGTLTAIPRNAAAVGGGFKTTGGVNANGAGPGAGTQAGTNSGAGGAAYCGAGGSGGGTQPGMSGAAYGNATITPLVGGSSGGGSGSEGGGAIQIVAATSITIGATGLVNVGGSGGGVNTSGGGAGGAILLESESATITGVLAANGGGGAWSYGGENATTTATAALGEAPGNASLAGNKGGDGAAGAVIAGTNGMGAGGGGGGAGWLRINTMSGAAMISGKLTPDATTTCTTQGKVAPAS